MKPQPPVTNMRIAALSSSVAEAAPVVSPAPSDLWENLRQRAATTDWTPWLIVALGAFLRFFLLGIKPPHFDEGINGWFVDQMVKNGFYRYDPTNYHGPLHFYILFVCQTLLGRNIWALRLPVVLAGIFSIHLTMKFEPFVGRNVSRWAALAMAVSPGFVFYGRYSIHEVWLLVSSMLFILGVLGLWRRGTVDYLWCAGMGLTGMILTKETYIIHVGCAVIAIFVTWLSARITSATSWRPKFQRWTLLDITISGVGLLSAGLFLYLGSYLKAISVLATALGWIARKLVPPAPASPASPPVRQTWTFLDLAMITGVGIAVIVFFYSGCFMNWPGVTGLWKTYEAWFKTGTQGAGHEKAYYYWLQLIARYEYPVLFGLFLAVLTPYVQNLNLRYLAIYGTGTLIAYSIVKYKTPWCIISIVWPLLFVFGAAPSVARAAYEQVSKIGTKTLLRYLAAYVIASGLAYMILGYKEEWAVYKTEWYIANAVFLLLLIFIALLLLALALDEGVVKAGMATLLAISLGFCISLNYFRCSTFNEFSWKPERGKLENIGDFFAWEPYVYVQTYNDVWKLTKPLLRLAKSNPSYYQMVGHLIRTSTYPLPWMLGDFTKVGYYEHNNMPDKLDGDFLLVQEDKIAEVETKLHDTYYTELMTIRPYQDYSKLYFNARIFSKLFPGRVPEFTGHPNPVPQPPK